MQKERDCVSNVANGPTAATHTSITELSEISVTHVAARRGARGAMDGIARATLGIDLPSSPRVIEAGAAMVAWAGPEQWLVIQARQGEDDASLQLAKTFGGLASVVDVSDSRTIFRISGARPSETLVRSMSIDFEDDVFRPGDVAITHVAHLGVIVWRHPDGSAYDFACARTYARDFLDWIRKV
jgi:heterotetrameric sarcosine oxidase gamma subunit